MIPPGRTGCFGVMWQDSTLIWDPGKVSLWREDWTEWPLGEWVEVIQVKRGHAGQSISRGASGGSEARKPKTVEELSEW